MARRDRGGRRCRAGRGEDHAAGVDPGSPWKRQQRRNLAWLRMAERFAADSSQGYPDHYGRYLEHFLGGRDWSEGWGAGGWEQARRPDTFG